MDSLYHSLGAIGLGGLARVRNRIPANHNPFNHLDRSIISIDTLKNNLEYRNYLETLGGTSSLSTNVTTSPRDRGSPGFLAEPG